MKLYHFLNAEYGLSAIQNQELKVSSFDNLNDPFELLGGGSGELEVRNAIRKYRIGMAEKLRLLCCSKSWSSPVLWGHYGDSHKGIALALEVPSDYVTEIDYVSHREEISKSDLLDAYKSGDMGKYGKMLLKTKYEQWSYEDEARVLFDRDEAIKKGGLEFVQAKGVLKITGVIKGPLCEVTNSDIESRLPSGASVEVTNSRLAFRKFDVVNNKSVPVIKLVSK